MFHVEHFEQNFQIISSSPAPQGAIKMIHEKKAKNPAEKIFPDEVFMNPDPSYNGANGRRYQRKKVAWFYEARHGE